MMKIENYNLEKFIEKEFYYEIYLTSKKDDQKKYVTKVYNREYIDQNNDLKKNLEMEIRILKYLNHPNIIKLHDVKKSKKHYFTIFEYCNGGSLAEALEKYMEKYGNPFPEEIIQHLMRQIINAFQYIDTKNIIHRLVISDNILLNYENEEDAKNSNLIKAQIKLIEFSVAEHKPKYTDHLSYNDSIYYKKIDDPVLFQKMLSDSSKATRHNYYDKKNDIWSIGCICYEILIGKSMFDEDKIEVEKFLEKIKQGKYAIPVTLSQEIISFINGMLEKKEKQRLDFYGLIHHDFLKKDINKFKRMNMKISEKIISGTFDINNIYNGSIWCIFNEKDESLLTSILGSEFVLPIEKNKETGISKKKEKETTSKKVLKDLPDNKVTEKDS